MIDKKHFTERMRAKRSVTSALLFHNQQPLRGLALAALLPLLRFVDTSRQSYFNTFIFRTINIYHLISFSQLFYTYTEWLLVQYLLRTLMLSSCLSWPVVPSLRLKVLRPAVPRSATHFGGGSFAITPSSTKS